MATGPELVTFLRARLGEDEQTAERMDHYNPDDGGYYACPETRDEPLGDLPGGPGTCDCGVGERRARALADVEAKRAILEMHGELGHLPCDAHDGATGLSEHCDVVLLLARPYAGHPDYRPEWRP